MPPKRTRSSTKTIKDQPDVKKSKKSASASANANAITSKPSVTTKRVTRQTRGSKKIQDDVEEAVKLDTSKQEETRNTDDIASVAVEDEKVDDEESKINEDSTTVNDKSDDVPETVADVEVKLEQEHSNGNALADKEQQQEHSNGDNVEPEVEQEKQLEQDQVDQKQVEEEQEQEKSNENNVKTEVDDTSSTSDPIKKRPISQIEVEESSSVKKIKTTKPNQSLPNYTIYIKNLNDNIPSRTMKENLYILFSTYADVIQVRYINKKNLRGQAWIVLSSKDEAKLAMRHCKGVSLFGKIPILEYSSNKSHIIQQLEDLLVDSESN